jgi:hypothetical protein
MRTMILAIVLAATACAARPQISTDTRNAALECYAKGESFEQIARKLHLEDRDMARLAVHEGMLDASKRYYRER